MIYSVEITEQAEGDLVRLAKFPLMWCHFLTLNS